MLSDSDHVHTLSIQKQFVDDSRKYNLTSAQTERDQLIAWKLHDALFNFLNEFYPGCNDDWSINLQVLMDTIFTCEETGGCVIHITRQYDGNKLNLPLTKICN